MERLAAIVLAAGRSSRMGALKPLTDVNGRTVLERAVGAFTQAGVDDVVVVAGHRRDEVAAGATAAGARVVTNPAYDQGMYSSLRVGVQALDLAVTRFFVLPADIPLVRPETIGRLIRQGRIARGGAAEVVYPLWDGAEGHPPLLSGALRAEIRAADPPEGLRELLLAPRRRIRRGPGGRPGRAARRRHAGGSRPHARAGRGGGLPDVASCLRLLAGQGCRASVSVTRWS